MTPRLRLRAFAAVLATVLAGALPAPVAAHEGEDHAGAMPAAGAVTGAAQVDEELLSSETELLGREHALEHQRQRQALAESARRWKAMTPAQRTRVAERRSAVMAAANAGDPAQIGRWEPAFRHRSFGMHAALLPTGKVLFWSLPLGAFGTQPNRGVSWIWDPAKGTGAGSFKDVDPPVDPVTGLPAPLYCSGESFLPDGRLLATGGNKAWPDWSVAQDYIGWEGVLTFNPWSETWTRQTQDMADGRWYPSQVLTGDGTTYIVGGYVADDTGTRNRSIERFDADGSSMDGAGGKSVTVGQPGDSDVALYPHLFTLPSGKVALAGPGGGDLALLDPATALWDWKIGPPGPGEPGGTRMHWDHPRIGSTAVLDPAAGPQGSSSVTQIGGYVNDPSKDSQPAVPTSERVDYEAPGGAVKRDGPVLNVPRSYHNTVLLPDGGMVTVGGGRGFRKGSAGNDGARWTWESGEARPVELLEQGSSQWKLGAAQAEDRGYHSVALLLADGRVLSAGDDVNGDAPNPSTGKDILHDTIELYSPPYLFEPGGAPAVRPVIDAAPAKVGYGQAFGVSSASAGVTRAVLMAPSATTHGADMTQRHVELAVRDTVAGKGVNLVAPASGNLAPPGHYMLFLLDADGTPSVARWVEIGAAQQPVTTIPPVTDPPDPPVTDPPDPPVVDPPGPPVVDPPTTTRTTPVPTPTPPAPPTTPVAPPNPPVTPPAPGPGTSKPVLRKVTVGRAELRRLAATGRVRVRITTGARVKLTIQLRLAGSTKPVVKRDVTLEQGTTTVTLKLTRAQRRRIEGRKVTIRVARRTTSRGSIATTGSVSRPARR